VIAAREVMLLGDPVHQALGLVKALTRPPESFSRMGELGLRVEDCEAGVVACLTEHSQEVHNRAWHDRADVQRKQRPRTWP
jgi:hypothetical protein